MQTKKGIRVKAKETSIVDNIVSFFKKDNQANPQHHGNQQLSSQINHHYDQKRNTSPRSTTPRKKIFNNKDKTPQKAGRINFTNANNNKSMDDGHEMTFNNHQEPHNNGALLHSNINRSHLSPKNNYVSNPLHDTQFSKLILDNSNIANPLSNNNLMNRNTSPRTPQKTFLGDDQHQNAGVNKSSNQNHRNLQPVSQKANQAQKNKSIQKQMQNQRKQIQQLKRQNSHLRKENQQFYREIQNLKKQIKSYELSAKNNKNGVQIVQLQAPKSPFEKRSILSPNQSIQGKLLLGYSDDDEKSQKFSHHSKIKDNNLPIMPQTAHQYGMKNSFPKMEQISLLSVDLKNVSHSQNSSFLSEDQSFEALSQAIRRGGQNRKNEKEQKKPIRNEQILSPFMEKTVYDKTMKPNQNKEITKQRKSQQNNKTKQQQVTFSKTVGYIKGDQPQQKIKNPFQEIATDSNKFYFATEKQKQIRAINSPQNKSKSFNVIQGNSGREGNNKLRQWTMFNQQQSSLGYSNNTGQSHQSNTNKLNLSSVNPFDRSSNQSPFGRKQAQNVNTNNMNRGSNTQNKNQNNTNLINKEQNKIKNPSSNQSNNNNKLLNPNGSILNGTHIVVPGRQGVSMHSNSSNNKNGNLFIQQSKTYRFQDFQVNEDQSNVDFF